MYSQEWFVVKYLCSITFSLLYNGYMFSNILGIYLLGCWQQSKMRLSKSIYQLGYCSIYCFLKYTMVGKSQNLFFICKGKSLGVPFHRITSQYSELKKFEFLRQFSKATEPGQLKPKFKCWQLFAVLWSSVYRVGRISSI